MKICYVISTVNVAGGANRSLLDLLPFVLSKGHECTVLACAHGSMEDAVNQLGATYKVIPFSTYVETTTLIRKIKRRSANLYGKYAIAHYLRSMNFDILHNNSLPTAVGMDVARMVNLPYICHIRENIWNGLGMEFYCPERVKSIIQDANKVITISDYILKSYSSFAPDADYYTINDGLRVSDYYTQRSIFDSDAIRIGIVGVINPQKGQAEAVKAVELLYERGYSNIELDIIGNDGRWNDNKDYATNLRNEVKQKNLKYINFIPAIEDTESLKKQREKYDINLICSNAEGLGRITIESMLSGSLTIAANAGATPEILVDQAYGLLYESGNPNDLAEKIAYAIGHRREMKEMAIKAQQYASERFAIERYAENIISLYNQIVKGAM